VRIPRVSEPERTVAPLPSWLRAGDASAAAVRRDRWLLVFLGLLMLAAGLGLRDPWPADEPRFALIARDMVVTGQWLFPQVGGDWYQDKPPLYFWAIALAYAATGLLRIAFLLPSLVAALGCLLLVHDLGRRLWSREVGLLAGLTLLCSLQFVIQARVAQIDMTLCLLTTAGLYGLLRHLLGGPDLRAFAAGGFACGLGVIAKGTGFLPLLVLLPFVVLRARGFAMTPGATSGWRWALPLAAALGAILLWLLPMVLKSTYSGDPGLAAYRDELLFKQTMTRYAAAWHHHEPWWYFLVKAIPLLWLPGVLLLTWALPRWLAAWRARDARPWLLLGWIALVLLFFSASPGKRGVYILPALPAFALALAPVVHELWTRRGLQRVGFALALTVAAALLGGFAYLQFGAPARGAELLARHHVASLLPLAVAGGASVVAALVAGAGRGLIAWALTIVCAVQGLWVNPQLDAERSGRAFIEHVEATLPSGVEFGVVGYREQFLLQATRPVVNFGHRRWAEGRAEAEDAALWLNAKAGRWLLVDAAHRAACFASAAAVPVGRSGGLDWFLVTGRASEACAAAGHPEAARHYEARGPR
jgi:4-amino-4-deoxy-L-arabinose transferase-like glycosyltransferase